MFSELREGVVAVARMAYDADGSAVFGKVVAYVVFTNPAAHPTPVGVTCRGAAAGEVRCGGRRRAPPSARRRRTPAKALKKAAAARKAPVLTTEPPPVAAPAPAPAAAARDGVAAEVLRIIAAGGADVRLIDEDCAGGTYWVRDSEGRTVAVFKPADEEPGAAANPKGNTEGVTKGGCAVGGGAAREVLAHKLDAGFAGVPETEYVDLPAEMLGRPAGEPPVRGSVQRFAPNGGQAWDSTPAKFRGASVRRVGLLDLRLLNCDRHGGNLLAGEGKTLIPIDHGFTLPSELGDLDFEWHMWPQARDAFTAGELAHVAALDPQADARLAREHGVDDKAADLLRAAGEAVKVGCRNGMTLRQLADAWKREELAEPESSMLERLVAASRGDDGAIDWARFASSAEKELRPPAP